MNIFELLNRFVVLPHIEVVVTTLPESDLSLQLESSRHLLFQNLHADREWKAAGFAHQQMHMFGHDDVSSDMEAVAPRDIFHFLLEDAVLGPTCERRLSSITTESYKVEVARVPIAD